jgi:hypothetical protein
MMNAYGNETSAKNDGKSALTVRRNKMFGPKSEELDALFSLYEYMVDVTPRTYTDHQARANEWGGTIASVTMEVENDWLVELFDSAKGAPKDFTSTAGNRFFIGAARTEHGMSYINSTGPESWVWEDFSVWDYTHWPSGGANLIAPYNQSTTPADRLVLNDAPCCVYNYAWQRVGGNSLAGAAYKRNRTNVVTNLGSMVPKWINYTYNVTVWDNQTHTNWSWNNYTYNFTFNYLEQLGLQSVGQKLQYMYPNNSLCSPYRKWKGIQEIQDGYYLYTEAFDAPILLSNLFEIWEDEVESTMWSPYDDGKYLDPATRVAVDTLRETYRDSLRNKTTQRGAIVQGSARIDKSYWNDIEVTIEVTHGKLALFNPPPHLYLQN